MLTKSIQGAWHFRLCTA